MQTADIVNQASEKTIFIKKFDSFQKLPHAFLWILILSTVSIILLWGGWFYIKVSGYEAHSAVLLAYEPNRRLLFISYFMISIWMWLVYFLSTYTPRTKVNSLRQLLSAFADAWSEDSSRRDPDFAAALQDKARASMTMLAMLTAASALLLTRALEKVENLDQSTMLSEAWNQLLSYCAAGASAIALICFIISVDSLDVLFNKFGNKASYGHNYLVNYFYRSTRNARYYGIMFLLWAVCLFCGIYNSLFGAFVLGITITTGWSHWFPRPLSISEEKNSVFEVGTYCLKRFFGATLIILPPLWAILL